MSRKEHRRGTGGERRKGTPREPQRPEGKDKRSPVRRIERHGRPRKEMTREAEEVANGIFGTKRWIEQEVIEQRTCPPLNKVVQDHHTAHDRVDWEAVSDKVVFVSYRHLQAGSPEIIVAVADRFREFIERAREPTAPMTVVQVLPDFTTNQDYDRFMDNVKLAALQGLMRKPEVITATYQAALEIQGEQGDAERIAQREGGLREMGLSLVDGAFNPSYFYGQDLSADDLAELPETRGPRERQRILSRAPFYIAQIVNLFGTDKVIRNLNTQRMYKQNTTLTQGIDPRRFGMHVDRLRKWKR